MGPTSKPGWSRLLDPRSIGLRFSGLCLGLVVLVGLLQLVVVRLHLVGAHEQHLNSRGEGLTRLAGQLLATPLELDAVAAGEEAAGALLADELVLRVAVMDPGGLWLGRGPEDPENTRLFRRPVQSAMSGKELGEVLLWLDQTSFQAAALSARNEALTMMGIVAGLGLIAAVWFARRLIAPLDTIVEAAGAIAAGQVERPPPTKLGQDEIGRAGRAFAVMQARLHELSESMRRVGAGKLDPPRLGRGPLFERFERMVAQLAFAQELEAEQRAELEQALRAAEEASAVKGRFLARVSHELRTPLNGVLGMVDLCLAEPTAPHRDDLEAIQGSAHQMLQQVVELLTFAQVDAGELELSRTPVEPFELIPAAVARFSNIADRTGVELEIVCSGPRVRGGTDPGAIEQALGCLIDNGIEFGGPGVLTIRADVDVEMSGLRIEVEDRGPGIAESDQTSIFEAFEQLDGSSTRTHGGVGVGLALAAGIARGLGGQIGVRSEVGAGSTFWFEVPLHEAEPTEEPSADAPGPAPRPSSGPLTVLLVEDERLNQRVAKRQLERLGVQVVLAENGREAVEQAGQQAFDLILMDCMMPEMDGYEATRAIRSAERPGQRVPIVAVTANALPGDRAKCLVAGMDQHIPKPLRGPVLADALTRWSGWSPE